MEGPMLNAKYRKAVPLEAKSASLPNPERRTFLTQGGSYFVALSITAALPLALFRDRQPRRRSPLTTREFRAKRVAIDAPWGKLDCYFARPKADTAPLPAVIVAHDKLGLTPHFEDVARRLAIEGFIALAPDLRLSFRRDTERIRTGSGSVSVITKTNRHGQRYRDGSALAESETPTSSEKIGAVGFGWARQR